MLNKETMDASSCKFCKIYKRASYVPRRYIFCVLAFFGLFCAYVMRANVSIAMLAMVNRTTHETGTNTSFTECANLRAEDPNERRPYVGPHYNWDAETQGLILGSFFYGYFLTQMPGGYIADRFGGKWIYSCGVVVPAILYILTPYSASCGTAPLILVCVFQGIIQGVMSPALNLLIACWSPVLERSRNSAFIHTGTLLGTVFGTLISGFLCGSDSVGGWPTTFYLFGSIGCLWFLFWSLYISDSPSYHPSISKDELSLFEVNTHVFHRNYRHRNVPWRSIFTSLPVWAFVIGRIGDRICNIMFLTELPNYLGRVLHYNIQQDGLLSSLPYIFQTASAWTTSYIADKMRASGCMTITNIRKLFNSIGMIGPAICLIGVTACGCRNDIIVVLLILAMTINGFVFSGTYVIHVDMSPDLAGTIFGFANTIAYICGASYPVIVGVFTRSGDTIENWSKVFYITAAVYIIPAVFFALFASAEQQTWSKSCDEAFKELKSNNAPKVASETSMGILKRMTSTLIHQLYRNKGEKLKNDVS